MKKLFVIIFVFSFALSFTQTKQFVYEYKSVPDSTQKNVVKSELMALNISDNKSEYFSLKNFISDSTVAAEIKDGTYYLKPPAPPQKRSDLPSTDRINKKMNSDKIEFVTRLSENNYLVNENINLKWKLHPEYITVLNYKAQKATTNFGGRQWTAWFTKEIPFQDGPYKFRGLPGLIVKMEDETKSHQFELKGIKNLNYNFIYPEDLENLIIVTDLKFKKAFKDYRKYPATDLKKRYPSMEHNEWVKNSEKTMLEQFKKDNNIIEIELLKE